MAPSIRIIKKPGAPAQHVDRLGSRRPLKLMSVQDAANYAKVSTQTVRRWIKAGQLKIYRAGRQIRIDEFDLVDYLSLQELKWL
jgi:excisionase family DNA binding protein